MFANFPFGVIISVKLVDSEKRLMGIFIWCEDNVGKYKVNWYYDTLPGTFSKREKGQIIRKFVFTFLNEEDAIMFKLIYG